MLPWHARLTVRGVCCRQYTQAVKHHQIPDSKPTSKPTKATDKQQLPANDSKDVHLPPENKHITKSERIIRARHLLRALLRESTYLPDPTARQWVSQHVLSRFRTYSYKAWEHRKDEQYGSDRLHKKEKEARTALATLRRANEGERKPLLKVLLMAYGRTGKRRHELMAPLLPVKESDNVVGEVSVAPEGTSSLDEVGEVNEATASTADSRPTTSKQSRTLDLAPPLKAILTSQMNAAPPYVTRRNPRRLNPITPELNSWQRPMPQSRIKNMKKKHYAKLLDQVQPPLPQQEWKQLRGLAEGTALLEQVKTRRKSPIQPMEASKDCALELTVMYGKTPSSVFEREFGKRSKHVLTPRVRRRLYAEVFGQCPMMELDAESKAWKIVWGGKRQHAEGVSLQLPERVDSGRAQGCEVE